MCKMMRSNIFYLLKWYISHTGLLMNEPFKSLNCTKTANNSVRCWDSLWTGSKAIWKCARTPKLFMEKWIGPIREYLMNKILWSLLMLPVLYGQQKLLCTDTPDKDSEKEREREEKADQKMCWQITMKKARVWHFVVYKLIYGTIRVFALQCSQQLPTIQCTANTTTTTARCEKKNKKSHFN